MRDTSKKVSVSQTVHYPKVVIGEVLPCPDLYQRLSKIYDVALLRYAESQANGSIRDEKENSHE